MGEYRCFVGGLPWATNESNLENVFRQFGDVVESKIISDRETGHSRGFGFVTFAQKEAMEDAIEVMNASELDGRIITVNQAQAQTRGDGGGDGGSGGRSGGRRGGRGRGHRGGGRHGSVSWRERR